jgi:uncharacterized OB-fold protein
MSTPPHPLWSDEGTPTLLASCDRDTGEWVFPVVASNSPLAPLHKDVPVRGPGVVYSFTVIHPSAKSSQAPCALGYVDFEGPVRIFGRLQGRPRPTIGERYAPKADAEFGYVFEAIDD